MLASEAVRGRVLLWEQNKLGIALMDERVSSKS